MKDSPAEKKVSQPKITILGVGNELLSDEGAGVHVIHELQKQGTIPEIEIIEGGTDGFGLLNIIMDAENLIVVDSVKGGGKPGSIYRFTIKDASGYPPLYKTSVHQIGILEVIHLSGLIGKTPETVVIGIEPLKTTTGMQLSAVVREKIPRIIRLIYEEIKKILRST